MFGRLAFVIVAIGLGACVLLAIRQVRIQAAHELAETRRRIVRMDHELWRLRAEIAERITPDRIHRQSMDVLALKSAVPAILPGVVPGTGLAAPVLSEIAGRMSNSQAQTREPRP